MILCLAKKKLTLIVVILDHAIFLVLAFAWVQSLDGILIQARAFRFDFGSGSSSGSDFGLGTLIHPSNEKPMCQAFITLSRASYALILVTISLFLH